jgi:hypothetical protein
VLKQGGFQFWNARENEILGLQKTTARSESDCGDMGKNIFKKQRVFQHNRPESVIQKSANKSALALQSELALNSWPVTIKCEIKSAVHNGQVSMNTQGNNTIAIVCEVLIPLIER